jgi:acetyltransferase-like isoleucine patch superfamily enzyme
MSFTFIQRLRNKIKVNKKSNINISKSVKIVGCKILIRGENNSLTIEENSILRHVTIEIIGNNCVIKIGKSCMIGDHCYLAVKEGTKLILDDNCGLSRNIKIMTSDGHPIFKNEKRINPAKDIRLGSHLWVADNVTILKGCCIGNGSVIGINSTVTKDIPANVIAVGNPARIVQENIEWQSKL